MSATIAWGYDAQNLGVISFTLTEVGGGGATGTVTLSGQYMHGVTVDSSSVRSVDIATGEDAYNFAESYLDLGVALKAALEAVGNATYTVVWSLTARAYNVFASGVTSFSIASQSTGAVRMLGALTAQSALYWASSEEVWHWTYAENLGFSRWDMRDASPDGAEALVGSDGSVRGLSALGTPKLLDFVVPSEPREAIRSDESQGSYTARGWTHQRAVYRCRSIEPALISPGDGAQSYVGYLRPDYTFAPRLKSADYLEVQDVPYSFHIVGELV